MHRRTHAPKQKPWKYLSKAIVALTVQVMGPLAWISAFMLSRPDSRPCSVHQQALVAQLRRIHTRD